MIYVTFNAAAMVF